MVLVLCTSSDDVLYLYKASGKYLKGFLVIAWTRNLAGQTDRWTDKVITIGPLRTSSGGALITSLSCLKKMILTHSYLEIRERVIGKQ